jgi:1,4-dihydroxy-2-naphthoate octaprenyltransferase
MSVARVLWRAARPKTLTAALVPVAAGTALASAHGALKADAALACLLVALFIQIGTNYANDLFDFLKGTDNEARLGPARMTSSGEATPRMMGIATAVAMLLGFISGLYLVSLTGWPLLVLGLVCIVAGVAYTGGPFPLAYNALGDVFVFVFFGLVATAGTYYTQAMTVHPAALVLGSHIGALATCLLIVNNTRDIENDRAHRKITTAVLLGAQRARAMYVVVMAAAYLAPLVAAGLGWAPMGAVASVGSLPLGVHAAKELYRRDGAALNPVLGKTSATMLVSGLLMASGVALWH